MMAETIIEDINEIRPKIVTIELSEKGYRWSYKNSVYVKNYIGPSIYSKTSPALRCYYAVKEGTPVSGIRLNDILQDREDMLLAIFNMDHDRGTEKDIAVIQKYAEQDGIEIVIE